MRVFWFLWVASSSGGSLFFSGSYSHPCTRIKAAAQYDQCDQVKRNLAQFKLWRRSALPRDQVRACPERKPALSVAEWVEWATNLRHVPKGFGFSSAG